jgi:hypothetical protein
LPAFLDGGSAALVDIGSEIDKVDAALGLLASLDASRWTIRPPLLMTIWG